MGAFCHASSTVIQRLASFSFVSYFDWDLITVSNFNVFDLPFLRFLLAVAYFYLTHTGQVNFMPSIFRF